MAKPTIRTFYEFEVGFFDRSLFLKSLYDYIGWRQGRLRIFF